MSGVDVREVLGLMREAADAGHRIALDVESTRAVVEHVEALQRDLDEVKDRGMSIETGHGIRIYTPSDEHAAALAAACRAQRLKDEAEEKLQDADRRLTGASVLVTLAMAAAVTAWWLG